MDPGVGQYEDRAPENATTERNHARCWPMRPADWPQALTTTHSLRAGDYGLHLLVGPNTRCRVLGEPHHARIACCPARDPCRARHDRLFWTSLRGSGERVDVPRTCARRLAQHGSLPSDHVYGLSPSRRVAMSKPPANPPIRSLTRGLPARLIGRPDKLIVPAPARARGEP